MKRSRISAKWQIYFCLLLFCLTLIGVLWLFQIVHLDTFYKLIKRNESNSVCEKLTRLILTQDDDIERKIDDLAEKHSMAILLISDDLKYSVYADYNYTSSLLNMPFSMFRSFVQAARENGGNYTVHFIGNKNVTFDDGQSQSFSEDNIINPDDEEGPFEQNHGDEYGESIIYISLVPCKNSDDYMIYMVNTVLTPVSATMETLKIQLIVVTFIMFISAIILGLIVSNMVSRPISKTNEAAKRLAMGDFRENPVEGQYREIAELSNTLNYAAKELGKIDEYQRELIANVSHDLRTPLTMITGYGEVMRDLPGENTPENVQVIIDEANRLTTLVNDMLDLSKLHSGVNELKIVDYDLTESIRLVLHRYNKLREQDGYVIDFEADKDVVVCADREKIYQVVYNLINNAINYTGEDKKVLVRQIIKEQVVRIEVCDSGEGIPKEELGNVWERYYKVDKTHRRSVQGTGLGLSIVKNILILHNADFGVESEFKEGSVFWFELELSKSQDLNRVENMQVEQ